MLRNRSSETSQTQSFLLRVVSSRHGLSLSRNQQGDVGLRTGSQGTRRPRAEHTYCGTACDGRSSAKNSISDIKLAKPRRRGKPSMLSSYCRCCRLSMRLSPLHTTELPSAIFHSVEPYGRP